MNLRIRSSEFAGVKGPFRWSYDKDDGTLVSVVDPCFGKFQNLFGLQEIFSKRLLSGVILKDRLCKCWAQSAYGSIVWVLTGTTCSSRIVYCDLALGFCLIAFCCILNISGIHGFCLRLLGFRCRESDGSRLGRPSTAPAALTSAMHTTVPQKILPCARFSAPPSRAF